MTEKPQGVDKSEQQLYDRQTYTFGEDAQKKITSSTILISGLGGVGVEVAKNLILSGMKHVILQDLEVVSWADLSSQFYLTEADLGKNRALACHAKLQELNRFVEVRASDAPITPEDVARCAVVVLCNHHLAEQERVAEWARQAAVKLIIADSRGLSVRVFCDFGPTFTVTDPTGENPRTAVVAGISQEAEGVVSTLMDAATGPHGFETGDLVEFHQVQGMTPLNGHPPIPIRVTGPYTFVLQCDTRAFPPYQGDGYVTQVKCPKTITHNPLSAELHRPTLMVLDLKFFGRESQTHLAYLALEAFRAATGRLPGPYSHEDAEAFVERCRALAATLPDAAALDEPYLRDFAHTCAGSLGPLAAVAGGIAGQEAIKAVTAKCGCGAIGCEILKNWAMMGLAMGPAGGMVHLTDMDSIEQSNLSRQFLFRSWDVGRMKSTTAAAAVRAINPRMASPHTQKVIVPHLTYTYSTLPGTDPAEEDIPTCTLKSFPYLIEHTIAWARSEFEGAFAEAPREALAYMADPAAAKRKVASYRTGMAGRVAALGETLAAHRPRGLAQCVGWARLLFERLFVAPVAQLLQAHPPGETLTVGGAQVPFWSGAHRMPRPLSFSLADPAHVEFLRAAALLRAANYGIQADEAALPTDPQGLGALLAQGAMPLDDPAAAPPSDELAGLALQPAEFEKDNDANHHVAFVMAASNLRAACYGIPPADWRTTKQIAGKICMELYKLAQRAMAAEAAGRPEAPQAPALDRFKARAAAPGLPISPPSPPSLHPVLAARPQVALLASRHPPAVAAPHRRSVPPSSWSSHPPARPCPPQNWWVTLAQPFLGYSEPLGAPNVGSPGQPFTLWDRLELDYTGAAPGEPTLGGLVRALAAARGGGPGAPAAGAEWRLSSATVGSTLIYMCLDPDHDPSAAASTCRPRPPPSSPPLPPSPPPPPPSPPLSRGSSLGLPPDRLGSLVDLIARVVKPALRPGTSELDLVVRPPPRPLPQHHGSTLRPHPGLRFLSPGCLRWGDGVRCGAGVCVCGQLTVEDEAGADIDLAPIHLAIAPYAPLPPAAAAAAGGPAGAPKKKKKKSAKKAARKAAAHEAEAEGPAGEEAAPAEGDPHEGDPHEPR
ncbi:putative Ubiquitin-activating enzyme E1 1 [Paratrimastix pyriformis]|uniref:Ubiquitin-activating enzyme E1 1 n=1 Tax=Paratrimastix pyriformis TaxID=342808 RepID=A0ABQ8UUX3_9EUKA|nr:putative Ubiquitin-activating enzyme E1 1 [Paratrimastix pyriformis]